MAMFIPNVRAMAARIGCCLRAEPCVVRAPVAVHRRMAHGRTWMDKRGRDGFKKRTTVEAVLFEDIGGVGTEGCVVTVNKGYAMNFLVRNGKGAIATKLNRQLYEKDGAGGKVNVTEESLISRLKKWVRRIESREISASRYKPSQYGISVPPFEIVERINRKMNMNLPAFTVDKIQEVMENKEEVKIFSRKEFDTKLSDFDALTLGEEVADRTIIKEGNYVVFLDLARGLDLDEKIVARLRIKVSGHGEGTTRTQKKFRTPNPRKPLQRYMMGIADAEWNGWDSVRVKG